MRYIAQPGPVLPERMVAVAAHGNAFAVDLEVGERLLDAVERNFTANGYTSGTIAFHAGALGPLAYVMPALSTTPDHAAFYSQTHRPPGVSQIVSGAMTFGTRAHKPFFHCHALWTEADGRLAGGHIMPEETVIAAPFHAQAMGIAGAAFEAQPDPETGFTLFGPVAGSDFGVAKDANLFAIRLRPNQDLTLALESFCLTNRISRAKLHGGVGSIIGVHFADGRQIEPFATEIAMQSGRIITGADHSLSTEIDIALVNYAGDIATGRLLSGQNPVLMTMELILEVLS